eukprot:scaffold11394_cov183-Amphora_coffeaeformis.AAC.11
MAVKWSFDHQNGLGTSHFHCVVGIILPLYLLTLVLLEVLVGSVRFLQRQKKCQQILKGCIMMFVGVAPFSSSSSSSSKRGEGT